MPRPLWLLKGIIEQDPSVTHDKIDELLGEAITMADEALKQLSTCLRLLLEKDQASKADRTLVDLGVRFSNDIRAANILVRKGFILNAMTMERDAIETRVVAEYLHKHPQKTEAWQKAETVTQRCKFAVKKLKGEVEDGNGWAEVWDNLSSYIHPNSLALPTFSGMRPFLGYNLYLGGFYAPVPIAASFGVQLAICINFVDCLMNWYKVDLAFPSESHRKIEMLNEAYHDQIRKLEKRASIEQQKIDSNVNTTRLSKEQIIQLWKFLDTFPH